MLKNICTLKSDNFNVQRHNGVYFGDVDHPVSGQIDHWVS